MGQLANAATLAADSSFRNMALVGLVYTARTVAAEDPATVNHDRRLWFANQVISNPTNYMDAIAWVTAADPTINVSASAALVSESTMLNSISTSWNYLSGMGVVRFAP